LWSHTTIIKYFINNHSFSICRYIYKNIAYANQLIHNTKLK
jgi:hypothetical protein